MQQLFGNRVRVREIKEPEETSTGLYLPESVRAAQREAKHFLEGYVVQIGEECSIPIKEGDVVLYYIKAGLDYEGDRVITEKDIIGLK